MENDPGEEQNQRPEPHTLLELKGLMDNGPEIVSPYKEALDQHPIVFQIIESAIQYAEQANAARIESEKLAYQWEQSLVKAYQLRDEALEAEVVIKAMVDTLSSMLFHWGELMENESASEALHRILAERDSLRVQVRKLQSFLNY